MGYGWIALLTDYGTRDGFVATCHGVIARIAPDVRVIDVTHDVPPQDVQHGAAVLAQTVPYLPPAVIVGVVDPGVGTTRRRVAIRAGESVLVGPDNGLLGWAADALGGVHEAVAIESDAHVRPSNARTFDGRDVFAPAAAHIAQGVELADLGPAIDDLVRLPDPNVSVGAGILRTQVLTVDHFGNVQLAATSVDLDAAEFRHGAVTVEARGRSVSVRIARTFADVAPGDLVLFVDSAGRLALAVNHGNAAESTGLAPGDAVTMSADAR